MTTANSAGSVTSKVRIAWTAPSNTGGTGVVITAYKVLVRDSGGSTFVAVPSGSGCEPGTPAAMATIVSNAACEIEMALFWTAPFNLAQGADIVAKVQAQNAIGWGSESAQSGTNAKVETKPHAPPTSPSRGAATSQTQLVADWLALTGTNTGGAPILSYALRYDDASGGTIWTTLVGTAAPSLALTHTVTTSVSAAATYLFQYRAQNIHGWSDWSPQLQLIAASAPAQISPAATTHNDGTQVRIQWTLPFSDGGKPITGYTIEVRN